MARCFFLVLLLLLTPPAFAQQPSRASKTTENNSPVSQTASKPDYSREAAVVEDASTTLTFESDGTRVAENSSRIRIQSNAGVERYGVLTFPYAGANESIEIDYVRVRKADGTVVVTPADDIQDMAAEITREAPFYSDLREKHVPVKNLSVGDVLEFHSTTRLTKPLIPGQFWYAANFIHDAIALHEQLTIRVPSGRAVKWSSPGLQPQISEQGALRIFTWLHSELVSKSDEQLKTEKEDRLYDAARGQLPPPDVQLSSFQSWAEIGKWFRDLEADRVQPTGEVQAKAAALTKGLSDRDAKVRALYDYVSTQFRYIAVSFGIGRYQPHSAAEVLSNQYGDCKDKHTLFAALLGASGIKSYPALISTVHKIDPDVPSPAQFDHVITVVPEGNDTLWLDTTPEVAPFGFLFSFLSNKPALVVYDDKPAAITKTPIASPIKAFQSFNIAAKLGADGTLEGKIDRELRGSDSEVLLRAVFRTVPLPRWKELVQQISYQTGFAGDVSDVTASPPEKIDDPLQFSYSYTRKDYPEWSERRISPPLPPVVLATVPDDAKDLTHPIWLGGPAEMHLHARVELPKGYSPELPGRVDLNEDFAEYHSAYSTKDGALVVDRSLVVKAYEVPAEKYEAYKSFRKKVDDDHALEVPLTQAGQRVEASSYLEGIWRLPGSDNTEASSAYDDARQKLAENDPRGAIAALKRSVGADPKFTRAWLLLGEFYKFTGQLDAALDAYRQAIAVDKQPVSYEALASTLMAFKKYDEAILVWQDLIKASPDDASGPRGLGTALLLAKRYKEASAVFESAAKADPQNATVQFQLGLAYVHLDSDDKALQTFQQALKLDSSTLMLNNIAFELADANKDLPLALDYAQRAVRDEEANSKKVQLELLTLEDLGRTFSLASYWDTLGWVYYRMGNLKKAEQYLQPAWELSQYKDVGAHLREVYARENKHLADSPDYLSRVRTIKLPRLVSGTANAEFFVALDSNADSSSATIQDVKFINGSEELKSATKALSAMNFKFNFPDSDPARVVRRGILGCYPYTGCSFTVLNPQDVHSVN